MIRLETWPADDGSLLEALYEKTDQSHCLVQLPVPLPKQQTENYLRVIRSSDNDGKPFVCFAILLDGRLIGKTELTRYNDGSAELDIIISREYCNKGNGTEALNALITHVFAEDWCHMIRAYTALENRAALKMLAKAGFRPGGTFAADIMVPDGTSYKIETKKGLECIREKT